MQETGERRQEKKGEQFQSQGLCKVRLWEMTELAVSQRVLYQITSTAKKTRMKVISYVTKHVQFEKTLVIS